MAHTAISAGVLCDIQLADALEASSAKRRVLRARAALVDVARRVVMQVIQPDDTTLSLAEADGDGATVKWTATTPIVAQGKVVGAITRLWASGDGRLSHILLREPPPRFRLLSRPRPEYILPATVELGVDAEGRVTVNLSPAAIRQLPILRADAAIEADVLLALEQALAVPQFIHAVSATVDDGMVHLSGVVDFGARKARAEEAVRAVPGVRDILNDIIAEDELLDRVDAALERALERPEVAGSTVAVQIEHAIVTLTGEAPSNAARRALEEAALSVPGVRVVVNKIDVAGRRALAGALSTHNR